MTGTLRRRVERLEGEATPTINLATLIEAQRGRVRTLAPAQLRQEQADRAAEMRGRVADLNRLERDVLAGLERVLAA